MVYGGSGSLSALDSDNDGSISQDEFAAYTGSFASADTDGSGSISAAELASFNTVYSFSGGLSAADFDGDGILSAAEFYAHTCVGPGCQVIFCLVTSFNVAVLGR